MRVFIFSLFFFILSSVHVFSARMVVIGNVDFPIESVTKSTVKDIYQGKIKKEGDVDIKPFDLPDKHRLKKIFVKDVVKLRSISKYNSFWVGMVFKEGARPPVMKKTVRDMIEAVASVAGGIGYCEIYQAKDQNGIKILLELD